MNQVAMTLAESGYHACIVNAWPGSGAAIAWSRSQSAG